MVLLLLALASACSEPEKPAAKAARPVPVAVALAARDTVPVTLQAIGNVEPLATVAVRSQVGGAIMEQYVRDGQDVKQGDLLFQIDPRPFRLAVQEAQARLDRDRALMVKAGEDLKRYVSLKQRNVVAQEQYDQTFSQAQSLEGTIKLDQAALERARLDLDYATIRAAISGRVGSVLLNKGNVIKANDDRVMCVINQIEPIYVSFSLPEKHLAEVMERHRRKPLAVEAVPSGGGKPVLGELASVDNAVDTSTGTIRLKALYPNKDRSLWPGQFVRAELRLATLDNVLMVPTRAVMDGLNGPYVYVAAPDSTAEARNLATGPIVGERTVVESGLEPGEKVVVDGQVRLAPGLKLEIKGDGKAVGTAQAPAQAQGAVQ